VSATACEAHKEQGLQQAGLANAVCACQERTFCGPKSNAIKALKILWLY
jgi:hypothetical protein